MWYTVKSQEKEHSTEQIGSSVVRALKEAFPPFSEDEHTDDKGDKLLSVFRSGVQDFPVSFILLVQPVNLEFFLPWLLHVHIQWFSHQPLTSCSMQ